MWSDFPKFLVGFLALAVLTNLSALPERVVDYIATVDDVLFLVAFAGPGFDIRFREMRKAGLRPVFVVGAYLFVASLATLLVVMALF